MISPHQLKVMMDANDMIKYDLNSDTSVISQINRRDALRRILRKAKDKTGFDSEGGRVTIRMFPSRDGGCEMFVTLIGADSYGKATQASVCGKTVVHDGMAIYEFDSFGELLEACKRLTAARYTGESFAYREDGRMRYYLVLDEASPIVGEMGGAKMRRGTAAYINEYCSIICAGAVYLLTGYA